MQQRLRCPLPGSFIRRKDRLTDTPTTRSIHEAPQKPQKPKTSHSSWQADSLTEHPYVTGATQSRTASPVLGGRQRHPCQLRGTSLTNGWGVQGGGAPDSFLRAPPKNDAYTRGWRSISTLRAHAQFLGSGSSGPRASVIESPCLQCCTAQRAGSTAAESPAPAASREIS